MAINGIYKAKDKKTNNWVYGYYFKLYSQSNNEIIEYIIPKNLKLDYEKMMWSEFYEIIPKTLCKHIINKKNVGDIYENDIVEFKVAGYYKRDRTIATTYGIVRFTKTYAYNITLFIIGNYRTYDYKLNNVVKIIGNKFDGVN